MGPSESLARARRCPNRGPSARRCPELVDRVHTTLEEADADRDRPGWMRRGKQRTDNTVGPRDAGSEAAAPRLRQPRQALRPASIPRHARRMCHRRDHRRRERGDIRRPRRRSDTGTSRSRWATGTSLRTRARASRRCAVRWAGGERPGKAFGPVALVAPAGALRSGADPTACIAVTEGDRSHAHAGLTCVPSAPEAEPGGRPPRHNRLNSGKRPLGTAAARSATDAFAGSATP